MTQDFCQFSLDSLAVREMPVAIPLVHYRLKLRTLIFCFLSEKPGIEVYWYHIPHMQSDLNSPNTKCDHFLDLNSRS